MTGKQPAAASGGMDDQASPRSGQVRADGRFVFRQPLRYVFYVFVRMTSRRCSAALGSQDTGKDPQPPVTSFQRLSHSHNRSCCSGVSGAPSWLAQ